MIVPVEIVQTWDMTNTSCLKKHSLLGIWNQSFIHTHVLLAMNPTISHIHMNHMTSSHGQRHHHWFPPIPRFPGRRDQRPILPQQGHGRLRTAPEEAAGAQAAEARDDVAGQAKGHHLGHLEVFAPFEGDAEVDVDQFTRPEVVDGGGDGSWAV